MALNFPNPSRKTRIWTLCMFWGCDKARAIAFLVDDALPEFRTRRTSEEHHARY